MSTSESGKSGLLRDGAPASVQGAARPNWMASYFPSMVAMVAALATMSAPSVYAQSATQPFMTACEAFKPGQLGEGEAIVSTTFQARGEHRPAYCLVRGTITTSPKSQINYRIDLPETASWNEKLMVIGGGGYDGYVPLDPGMGVEGFDLWTRFVGYQGPNLGSYVLVASDSGHQGRGKLKPLDATWAADNPDAVTNHAYRANHLVLWAAVRISQEFYGREPKRRYMVGGSNGGRQGIVAAQRYPDDYHGVIAFFPALSIPGMIANWPPLFRHIYKSPENWFGPEALSLFIKSEVAACDELDGLKDGVIGNYKACKFDGMPLACAAGVATDPKHCLTPGQIETVRLVRSYKRVDSSLPGGLSGYPGYGVGAAALAWNTFLLGSNWESRDAFSYIILDHGIKWFTNDPNEDPMGFDATKWRDALVSYSELLDPTPDLNAFFARGGKIILWHGVADTIVSHERTGEFVGLVERTAGAAATRKSLRFFLSPTLDHYGDGPEANTIPFLAKLEDWVEKGKAPNELIATRLDPPDGLALRSFEDRAVSFTRPVCEYGKFPRYKGKGDSKKASSFSCSAL